VDEEGRRVLKSMLEKNVAFDQPMERWTTFRVGGKVDALCFVENLVTLRRVLAHAKEKGTPYLVVGRGSNLLVKDQGLIGMVLILRGQLARMEMTGNDGDLLCAGAGLPLSNLLNECRHQGLGGLEFLAGIPGAVGGAVAMNAGAWGKETADVLHEIEILSASGELVKASRANLRFSYRHLCVPEGSVIVKATFQCVRVGSQKVGESMRRYLDLRRKSQPLEYASGGSVFKNPPGDFAGRLIDGVGLKGFRVGGAMISTKHANFIVNTGGAKACDVLALMDLARKRVREEMGVDLQPEIRVVGT
jgi:UDP-N-acetylmuramate dehydrogenase